MRRVKVIAVSGHAQNGKDTAAKMIKLKLQSDGYKVLIIHYADLLKYICKSFFDWDGSKDEYGRTLLQRVGTDIVRKQNPDYWVDFVADMLNFFDGEWDYVIIPDTRFSNEIQHLRERNIYTIHLRITRPEFASPLTAEQQLHPSETSLDDISPDYLIENDSGLDEFNAKLTEWVTEVLYER